MTIHTTWWPDEVEIGPGETGLVSIAITNTSSIINAYHVEVFGLDPAWVEAVPATVSLFPGDTQSVEVSLRLPDDYPASDRTVSFNVVSEDKSLFALNPVGLNVRHSPETAVAVDPVLVNGGRQATFGLVVTNSGNTPTTATGFAIDPEDLAEFTFDPPSVVVHPGREQVIKVTAQGGRAWFGQPRARTFTFGVDAERRVETLGTFIQRAKISRWLLSLLGLLAATAVFAIVLSGTFGRVVEEAQVDDNVLDAALDPGEAGGTRIPSDPRLMNGRVTSTTGGPLSGVQVDLFAQIDVSVPVASAVTSATGDFILDNLGTGEYLLQVSGAGIDPAWYQQDEAGVVTVTDEAQDATFIPVGKGTDPISLDDIAVRGIPVAVSGTIKIDDTSGVTLRLIVPGTIEAGTQAVVAEVELGADGSFTLPDVPSPGAFVLVVEKAGLPTLSQDIELEAGEPLPGIDISFSAGAAGVITGLVSSRTLALDGAVIRATNGDTSFETVSVSAQETAGPADQAIEGSFTLRDLPVPAVYTVTIELDGFAAQTCQVALGTTPDDAAASASGCAQTTGNKAVLDSVLLPATGSISGNVSIDGVQRAASVALTGKDIARSVNVSTQSGTGAIGIYSFAELPAPGTYTLTFSGPDLSPQVVIVTLDPSINQESAPNINVTLVHRNRTIAGAVQGTSDNQLRPVGEATVVLSNGAISRTVQTSDNPADPIGAFRFTDVLPGTYTLSASLPGAVTQVRLIDVNALSEAELDVGVFQLGEQANISGSVTVLQERPAPLGTIEIERSVLVRLFTPEQFPAGEPLAEVQTDLTTGAYSFPALETDRYLVAVYESITTSSPLNSIRVDTRPGESSNGNLTVTLR